MRQSSHFTPSPRGTKRGREGRERRQGSLNNPDTGSASSKVHQVMFFATSTSCTAFHQVRTDSEIAKRLFSVCLMSRLSFLASHSRIQLDTATTTTTTSSAWAHLLKSSLNVEITSPSKRPRRCEPGARSRAL